MVPLLIRLKATEPVITDRRTVGLPSVGGPPQTFESEVPPRMPEQDLEAEPGEGQLVPPGDDDGGHPVAEQIHGSIRGTLRRPVRAIET